MNRAGSIPSDIALALKTPSLAAGANTKVCVEIAGEQLIPRSAGRDGAPHLTSHADIPARAFALRN